MKLNMNFLLAAIVAFILAGLTLTGDILRVIKFSDPLAELFFCVTSTILGTLMLSAAVERVGPYNSKK